MSLYFYLGKVMKLRELLTLKESDLEVRDIEQVWEELKGEAAEYVPQKEYSAKFDPVKKEYTVYDETDNTRTLYAVIPKSEFTSVFRPLNTAVAPDREGLSLYRLTDSLEAVEYRGDTFLITIGTKEVSVKSGDFITRTVVDKKFVLSVEDKNFFKKTYTRA